MSMSGRSFRSRISTSDGRPSRVAVDAVSWRRKVQVVIRSDPVGLVIARLSRRFRRRHHVSETKAGAVWNAPRTHGFAVLGAWDAVLTCQWLVADWRWGLRSERSVGRPIGVWSIVSTCSVAS